MLLQCWKFIRIVGINWDYFVYKIFLSPPCPPNLIHTKRTKRLTLYHLTSRFSIPKLFKCQLTYVYYLLQKPILTMTFDYIKLIQLLHVSYMLWLNIQIFRRKLCRVHNLNTRNGTHKIVKRSLSWISNSNKLLQTNKLISLLCFCSCSCIQRHLYKNS